jgi:transposase
MGYNFIPCNREQLLLMPPDLREWVQKDHLVWFVLDAMAQMDLSAFYEGYREDGAGHTAFDPSMLASLLVYSYCRGQRSSRQMERLCEEDVVYRVITANQKPDHSTIARFRQDHLAAFERLFVEVLRLCKEAKLIKLGVVALDGTKMGGNTSLAANRTLNALTEEVRKILREAEETDAREDAQYGKDKRGDELPEELVDRKSRLARLKECKARLEREAEEAKAEQQRKIDERAKAEEESGQKMRGRAPRPPEETVDKEAKANVTDPDSRILKTRNGYEQGYNAQAVATENQIIVGAEVTKEENDIQQFDPMMESTKKTLTEAGVEEKIGAVACDAGYCSDANLATEEKKEDGPELFIATKKDWKQRKELKEASIQEDAIPEGLSLREKMECKLRTVRGKAIYAKRKIIIEPVFGQIKDVRKIRSFMMRGIEKVSAEWKLICATHNLLKLFRHGKVQFA